MHAIEILRQGDPVAPNVQLRPDHPDPTPGPGMALVRTEASGLNQLDLWVGRGVPGFEVSYPAIPGSDAVGTVTALGEGVSDQWSGARVLLNAAVPLHEPPRPGARATRPPIRMIGEHGPGTMAEFFTAPVSNLLQIPDRIEPVQAAAFGLAHLTAWRMLVTRAKVASGSTVLVTGIGGGVAQALMNIAKHFGCEVIVTSRSQRKLERALELGADASVLDEGGDFSREVRKLTGKRGVDVCADSIGQAVHTSCLKSLARGGTFVTCGCTSGPRAETDLARIFWNELTVVGSTMGDMEEFAQVCSHLRSGTLSAIIDSVHPPKEAQSAFSRLESGDHFGKIVVDWRS